MKINFWVPGKMLHCGPEEKGLRPAATRHPKIARLGS